MIEDQPRDTIPNPFIFDQVNTIKKMCQKRAYVAAVLMAGNVSDYFTQDVEDSDEVGPNIDTGSAPKAEPKAEVKIENPGQIEVGFPKALKLFGGKAPTVEQLFAEDPDYCNWIYQNGKGDWAKAVRAFMDTQQVVQREAQQEGKQPSGVDIVDAVEDAETILAQTEGDLTPTHYWGMVRKMGIDEASAADIANQGGGDWRKALQLAVNAKRGIK